MRRMRDHWYYLLLGVPAAAITFGIQYYVKKHHSGASHHEEVAALKPSEMHVADAHPDSHSSKDEHAEKQDTKKVSKTKVESERIAFRRVPAHVLSDDHEPVASDNGVCRSIEYRGEGPVFTNLKAQEWDRVLTQFREVKTSLIEWVEKHRTEFPEQTAGLMIRQIERTRIQRPPSLEEPDLTWRGIGVWSQSYKGDPLIRVGSGIAKLAQKHPARAKFELARLVAQSWTPCELQRLEVAGAWDPLMRCLGVTEQQGCEIGTYSEAGWAVSSTVAAVVAEPGCKLPAFESTDAAKCLKAMPGKSLQVALGEAHR
jgi:hypothetical protein